ncbi:hypothetical protein BGX26_003462, partial [Mortierella sp. AD094]
LPWLERKIVDWGCMQALIDVDAWKEWKKDMEGTSPGSPSAGSSSGPTPAMKKSLANAASVTRANLKRPSISSRSIRGIKAAAAAKNAEAAAAAAAATEEKDKKDDKAAAAEGSSSSSSTAPETTVAKGGGGAGPSQTLGSKFLPTIPETTVNQQQSPTSTDTAVDAVIMHSFTTAIIALVAMAVTLTIPANAYQPLLFAGDIVSPSAAGVKFKDTSYSALSTLAVGPYSSSSIDAVKSHSPITASGAGSGQLFKLEASAVPQISSVQLLEDAAIPSIHILVETNTAALINAAQVMDIVAALEQRRPGVDLFAVTTGALLMLRSRSSSPTPRRFASVLAYHATPPPESCGKRKAAPGEQLSQQQQQHRLEHEEHEVGNSRSRGNTDRDESPSRIAFRNLEESWKRFELDSVTSPPLNSNSTLGSSLSRPASPLSRPASPMPPSKLPYRELIECASLSEARNGEAKEAAATSSLSSGDSNGLSAPLGKSETKNRDHPSQQGHTKSMTASQSKPSDPEVSASSTSLSSKPAAAATTAAVTAAAAAAANYHSQHTQGFSSTFLASNEARHILDLPSLLGRDPNMIPEVLAMPVPLQATHTSMDDPSSTSPIGSDDSTSANLLSNLNAKAETTAQAMTKRYATKNLNMTETEAHRMVQMMAAEIVALHEEREVMVQKLEQAKQEMLEAAKLLRAKAAMTEAIENAGSEMQDMSSSSSSSTESRLLKREEQEREEEEERQRQTASLYDKDEWKV